MLNSSVISLCNDGRYQAGEHPKETRSPKGQNPVLVVNSLKVKTQKPTGPKKNRDKKAGSLTDQGHCPVLFRQLG